jgi:DNA polymerase I
MKITIKAQKETSNSIFDDITEYKSTDCSLPIGQTFVIDKKAFVKNHNLFDMKDTDEILDLSLARYLADSSQKMELYYIKTTDEQLKIEGEKYLKEFNHEMLHLWKEIESPLTVVLAQMETTGMYIDKQKLSETAALMQSQLDKITYEIKLKLGNDVNLNSPQQLGHALIQQGFVLKKSKTGSYSTDKNVLDGLLIDDRTGLIQNLLDYRTISKLLGTYTLNLIDILDDNSRIHCTINQTQAATGRLSSANPNLQNIPIRNQEFGTLIRSCFAAPNGRLILSADYSQIELRILAHLSQDQLLIDAFKSNQDIHRRTAAEIFNTLLDQVTKEQRVLGKTLNFALVYQQGAFATARMLGITQEQAKEFTKIYFDKFPKVKPFVDATLLKAKELGYVESIFGRRRYFKNLNSKVFLLKQADERAAFNAVLQGSNADLIKIAMVEIYNQIQKENLDAKIIMQVHDELVFEVAQEYADTLKKLVTEIMSNPPIGLLVPVKIDIHIGKNWVKK